jgi:hypothetical protein
MEDRVEIDGIVVSAPGGVITDDDGTTWIPLR